MLQIALLLLGYALSNYLFSINKTVAGVVIGFTAFGFLFYLLVVSAATLSYTCPFQTPLSLIIRSMIRFDNEHKRYFRRSKKWFGHIFSFSGKRKPPRTRSLGPHGLGAVDGVGGTTTGDLIELGMANTPQQSPSPFNKVVWDGYVQDSASIIRLFGISTDPDVILTITKFIPETVWHAGIRTTPLERLYDIVLECFDRSSGHPVVIPKLRNEAYLAAKALLHLVVQRKSIGDGSDEALFRSISDRHQTMGTEHYEGDSDLESTLSIIDRVFDKFEPISWSSFSPTTSHLAWMSHILLYHAWDSDRKGNPLPDHVGQFVLHSLRLDPPPRPQILADCLLIIGMVLGNVKLRVRDLLVTDKSRFFQEEVQLFHCSPVAPQINRIYEKLVSAFQTPFPTTGEIDRALAAMELIAPLSIDEVAKKSYHLFHVIMRTSGSLSYSQDKMWQAARHAIHGAYKWDKFLPWVEDPEDILTFLDHHFDLATRYGENQDGPIQDALCALAYASGSVTFEALKRFDPAEPSFVHGICYVYQDNKPFQLRKAALFFLPLIGQRWFNTPHPIMGPYQTRRFCKDWASAVDAIEHTPGVQKAALEVLFGMMNSVLWRPHIVPDKWNLLEYFASVPDDSQALRRCLDNPELMDAVSEVENPAAIVHWLAILWLKYKELIPEVREQLETKTKAIARGGRKADLDEFLTVMDSELAQADEALSLYNTWSTDPAAIALRVKLDNLQQAKVALVALKGGG